MARHEVRLAGFGGQGIIMSGYILGKAAALYDGKDAVFTQSYGPEARGGACAAEVVIDDDAVDYPVLTRPDILVLMSQEAALKYSSDRDENAIVLIDEDLVPADAVPNSFGAPTTRIAEDMGRRIVANIAMLGFLTGATNVVSRGAMEEAIKSSVPEKTIPLNLNAFNAGFEYGQRSKS
jgi:2-oxoglutarate ferredoxin oxidoreductase subunit gamma